MGSISFRQGQKALACRLAHCVALTNDVAWKKPNQALLYLWCNIIVKPALIGSIFKLVMMKTRPWWWDQVGTPHSQRCPSAPKYPATDQGAAKEGRLSVFGDCFVLVVSFCEVLNWVYVSTCVFLLGDYACKVVLLSCCLTNILKTIYQHRRCSYKTVDLWWPSIHPSIHPSHPLFALHRPERHKMKNQDNLQRTKMNGDELKSHLVHTNCQ